MHDTFSLVTYIELLPIITYLFKSPILFWYGGYISFQTHTQTNLFSFLEENLGVVATNLCLAFYACCSVRGLVSNLKCDPMLNQMTLLPTSCS